MSRRAGIYARISSDREGRELGVDRQQEDATALIEQRGWTVAGTWVENDVTGSGKKPRPQFRALLDAIRADKIDVVVVWNLHRLVRNARDRLELIELCRDKQVTIALVRGSDLDPTTPNGRLHIGILGEVAQNELDEATDRITRAKEQAAAKGWWRGGRRPYGYDADGVTVRPAEAHLVREMTRRVLIGESLHSIARELDKEGHRTATGNQWSSNGVRRVVMRSRNAGLLEHKGDPEAAEAEWPAIVDRDTWRAARAFLDDPARQPARTTSERFLGAGVYRCGECDDLMISKRTRGTGKTQHPAYKCATSNHVTRIAAPVDELVSEVVIERLSRPDARLLLHPPESKPVDVAGLQEEAATRQAQLSEVSDLFSDMKITGEQFARSSEKIRARLDEVHQILASTVAGTPLEGIADADDVRAAWEAAPIGRKKAVVNALMTVTVLKARRGRKPDGSYFDPNDIRVDPKTTPNQ